MDEKLDRLMDRLATSFDGWLTEFEARPVRTAFKVLLVLWLVREAYGVWRGLVPGRSRV